MRKIPKSSLFTVSILVLLSIGSIFLFHNARNTQNQVSETANKRSKTPIARVQNVEHEINVLQINNLSMGETIKNHLKNDPSVFVIGQNEKNESHYIKKEVTVKFKIHPTDVQNR